MLSEGQMGLDRATAIVGKNFSKQLLILSKNRDKTKELTKEYKNNTTGLDDMAKKMGQTTQAKIKKMSSAIEGLQLEFGALIADALTPLINKITDLASNFTNLDGETKKTIITVAGIAAAIGPLLLIVAGATSAFGFLSSAIAFLVSPIGLAIAALVVLPIAFKYIIDNWEAFAERLGDWSWWRNAIIQVLQWTLKYNPFSVILKGAQGLYDFLGIEAKVYNPFDELADSLEDLKVETKDYEHEFGNVMDSIKDGMKNLDIKLPNIFGNTGGGGTSTSTEGGDDKEQFVKSPFDFSEEYEQYLIQLEAAKVKTQEWSNAMNQFGLSVATSFADSFASVLLSGGNLLEGLGQIFVDLGKQIAAMVIKAAVLAALLSITGLGGTAMASGGIFSKGAGFSNILQGMMGGAFANGGQPPVGKMSLVGERGPELFVPGSSGTIIPNHALGGGGTVIPDVRITGDDLLIVFDRANRRKERR